MAGCSSNIRIAHFKNFRKDVVMSRSLSSNFSIARFQCSRFYGNSRLFCKNKKHKLVIVNAMDPKTDPQSSVAASTIVKQSGIGRVENGDKVMENSHLSVPESDSGGGGGDIIDGSGGNGKFSGEGDSGGEDYEEKEFGPLLKFEVVIIETEARGTTLPADMLEAAKTVGLRELFLLRYLELQGSVLRSCVMLRNRMLADPSFLCKIGTEGILYPTVGFGCGIIGQGIANLIMTAKRSTKKSEDDIPVPSLIKSAANWGVFLEVSSNTRYQIINGLEGIVEASPVAKKHAFTFDFGLCATVSTLLDDKSGGAAGLRKSNCGLAKKKFGPFCN